MQRLPLSNWLVQSGLGVALVLALSLAFSSPSAQQAQPPAPAANGSCPDGFAAIGGKCVDVNECSTDNGGCHKLAACGNMPGSRTCSACPEGYDGNGYVGCFDLNECPGGDCSAQIPADAETAPPPVVTTSGDVTVAATSEAGAAATFSVSAKDSVEGAKAAYCLPRSGSTFPIGKTVVSCWAFNKRGKIGRAALTVTVTRP
jgi:EGF domain-containing protein